ncbi:Hypothetical_protein [Hexamita inflata]|uniref:Hypothetical_protein n=1 Tax=Hexamita inflata TaxID=28002 RepID=A0AA86QKV9_9EUKA|nr:Hypothetical protein HINF_LOCUS24670 [Hexamita inflata]CAI9961411.1 Hypothetical protein HINF_LOCUS49056 [Hexamita inflata]
MFKYIRNDNNKFRKCDIRQQNLNQSNTINFDQFNVCCKYTSYFKHHNINHQIYIQNFSSQIHLRCHLHEYRLILLFTYNIIVQQSELYTVSYSVLFILLSNSLNQTIEISFVSVFRPNLFLKRFDRTYSFFYLFVSAFVLFFFNLLFQLVLFSLTNVLFKNIFGYVSDQSFYYCCVDGLIGIFSAYATAYAKAEQNVTIMLEIGTFKLLLSVGLWLVGKYTNSGNAQFSYMLYYKYCIDIIGAAFYLIISMRLRLRKRNQDEEMLNKPQLVLLSLLTIEPIISGDIWLFEKFER